LGRPLRMQPFSGAGEPLDLVLVIESSALYGPKKIVVPPPAPPAPKGERAKPQKGKPAAPTKNRGNKVARDTQVVPPGGEPLDKVKDAVHALLEGLSPRVRVLLIDYGADLE